MRTRYILWGIVLFWMVVIFNLSSDNRDVSSYKSKQLTATVRQAVSSVPESIKLVDPIRNVTEHIVRKTAHILEYFLLTMLVIAASVISHRRRRTIFANALIIPLLFAVSDELHQLYTPGRGAQVVDVFIDGVGVMLGIAIFFGLCIVLDAYSSFRDGRI